MQIKTNNRARPILSAFDLSARELAEFDYLTRPDLAQFFRYRGAVYDMGEFVRIVARKNWRGGFDHAADDDSPLLAWDAIQTDTFFSGIVFRYAEDGDAVVIGSVFA